MMKYDFVATVRRNKGNFQVQRSKDFHKAVSVVEINLVSAGIFAAPVTGMYYFTFFYHAGGAHPVSLALIKNNQIVVTAYDHQTANDGADNGGNAVFVQLQQGDQVYVRLGATTTIWGNNDITTFSGFLVSQG